MHLFLYVAAAWIAVDVLVVWAWHHAHVVARRDRTGVVPTPSVTPGGFSLAPAAGPRAGHRSAARARPAHFQLIDA